MAVKISALCGAISAFERLLM